MVSGKCVWGRSLGSVVNVFGMGWGDAELKGCKRGGRGCEGGFFGVGMRYFGGEKGAGREL